MIGSLVTVAVVAATVLAVVLVSDGDNDNIETTGTTRTTLGGAPPAVHEASAHRWTAEGNRSPARGDRSSSRDPPRYPGV